MSKKTSRCPRRTKRPELFPVVYYQALTIEAERALVGFQPKLDSCGHHHAELRDALACAALNARSRTTTHRLIIAHAVYGWGPGNRELYWLDEQTQEFVEVRDSRERPSPSFVCVPTPSDFQELAARVFEPAVVLPGPGVARLLVRPAA